MAAAAIAVAARMRMKNKNTPEKTDEELLEEAVIEASSIPDYRNPEKFSGVFKPYIEFSSKMHEKYNKMVKKSFKSDKYRHHFLKRFALVHRRSPKKKSSVHFSKMNVCTSLLFRISMKLLPFLCIIARSNHWHLSQSTSVFLR